MLGERSALPYVCTFFVFGCVAGCMVGLKKEKEAEVMRKKPGQFKQMLRYRKKNAGTGYSEEIEEVAM